MKSEKLTKFVISLIKATQSNELKWVSTSPPKKEALNGDVILDKIYKAQIEGEKYLQLYRYKNLVWFDEFHSRWEAGTRLELVDRNEEREYEFEYENSINDLYEIVREKTSGISKVVASFLAKHSMSEEVFQEKFSSPSSKWKLNYWGSSNTRSVRFGSNYLILESNETQWNRNQNAPSNENGAFIDVDQGIYEGLTYQVRCLVKSSAESTMGFKLWVHDVIGDVAVTEPSDFDTPGEAGKNYELTFTATKTNKMRIHLHARAGTGMLMVYEVFVARVDSE
jgi:hypothetical protein